MPPLTKEQRREYAKLAHELKPELLVGKDGFSPAFLNSLDEAFNTKELLKIKMLDSCPLDRDGMTAKLEKLKEIQLVRNIGRTFILYKQFDKDKDKKKKSAAGKDKS